MAATFRPRAARGTSAGANARVSVGAPAFAMAGGRAVASAWQPQPVVIRASLAGHSGHLVGQLVATGDSVGMDVIPLPEHQPLTIGRWAGARLQLYDTRVSRLHAQIEYDGDDYIVVVAGARTVSSSTPSASSAPASCATVIAWRSATWGTSPLTSTSGQQGQSAERRLSGGTGPKSSMQPMAGNRHAPILNTGQSMATGHWHRDGAAAHSTRRDDCANMRMVHAASNGTAAANHRSR